MTQLVSQPLPDLALPRVGSRRCRACEAPLSERVLDLGMQPLSNAFVAYERLAAMEPTYPLQCLRLHRLLADADRRRRRARRTSSRPTTPTSRRSRPPGSTTHGATPSG